MTSQKQIQVEEENKRMREALDFIHSALIGDSLTLHPTKALSRDVLNEALAIAGYKPVEGMQIDIIGYPA